MYQPSKSVICYSWREISAGPRGHIKYWDDDGFGTAAYSNNGCGSPEGALDVSANGSLAKVFPSGGPDGHTNLGGELSGFEQLVLNQYITGSIRFSYR